MDCDYFAGSVSCLICCCHTFLSILPDELQFGQAMMIDPFVCPRMFAGVVFLILIPDSLACTANASLLFDVKKHVPANFFGARCKH